VDARIKCGGCGNGKGGCGYAEMMRAEEIGKICMMRRESGGWRDCGLGTKIAGWKNADEDLEWKCGWDCGWENLREGNAE